MNNTKYRDLSYWLFGKASKNNFNNLEVDKFVKEFKRKNDIDYRKVSEIGERELENPYKDKGKIVTISFGEVLNLFDKRTALYSKDGKTFLVEFNDYAKNNVSGEFVLEGAYKYITVIGSENIAYKLKEIKY